MTHHDSTETDDGALDPVTLSVIQGRLEQIANEMDQALVSTAFSPIICETRDMTNGLYRPDGSTIAQGRMGIPIFVGGMEFVVRDIANLYEGEIEPGDVFMTNDPDVGGSHNLDMRLLKPYFVDGTVIAYLTSTGHWADIGGASPGGFSGEAQSIYQEGIVIPPVKLYDGAELNDEVLSILFENVRRPEDIRGDFKAQLNAIDAGETRLDDLIAEHGAEQIDAAIDELERRSERQMRSRIQEIPNGSYEFTDYLDNDGNVDEPVEIGLEMTVHDEEIEFDFDAPPARVGGPLNCPKPSSVSCCNLAIKHIYTDIPINGGCFKPIKHHIPERSILDARRPRASGGYFEVACRVVDVVMGALAQAIPEEVPAQAFSTSGAVTLGGETDEGEYMMQVLSAGGYGGSREYDGLSHATPPYAVSRMPNIEILENRYPVLLREKLLRADSGGAGRRRGGLGTRFHFEVLDDDAYSSCLGDRVDFPPSGVAGGQDADGAMFKYVRSGEEYVPPLRSKGENIHLTNGDSIILHTPGGGGYGDPAEREPERVLEDVEMGYVTQEAARRNYRVAVEELSDGFYRIDEEATRSLRD